MGSAGTDMGLSSSAIELINRCKVMPIFVKDGFTPFLPEYDEGVDFILYREFDDLLIKVQQKSRWTIDRKYENREIAVLFPDAGHWYLCPHQAMIRFAGENTEYLKSNSWAKGSYSVASMSQAMAAATSAYRLSPERSLEMDNSNIYLDCAASRIVQPMSGETTTPIKVEISDDRQIMIDLEDGRKISVPISHYTFLEALTPQELSNFEVLGSGIWWESIDEGISIASVLRGSMVKHKFKSKMELSK